MKHKVTLITLLTILGILAIGFAILWLLYGPGPSDKSWDTIKEKLRKKANPTVYNSMRFLGFG